MHARAVIVGGGIIGCSTAYHLAKLGWRDIVLLERYQLTSGSTFHAAGLVGQLRTSASITKLLGSSVALYSALEKETGQSTGWKMNGGLRLACITERLEELKRQATTAKSFGLEMHLLSAKEAQNLWPLMSIHDIVGAAFLPTDGQADPSGITQALAIGARQNGVKIIENCDAVGVELRDGQVRAVNTSSHGRISCDVVVNCAGQWARQFGQLAGVNVPLVSFQHQYLMTQPVDGVTKSLPTLRDPDRLTYWKEDVGGFVMGGYEPNPKPYGIGITGVPTDASFRLLTSDWDHFDQLMGLALQRVPALATAGVKELLNGPESFTPDGNFILGEAPEVRNYFVGAGFNAFGIASAGGAGKALAEWIVAGECPYDLWPVDIRRFGAPQRSRTWVLARSEEMYGKHYAVARPFEEYKSARPLRKSALFDKLSAKGAIFGEKLGWERPNFFSATASKNLTYEQENQLQPAETEAEHIACRTSAALFDQSSFAKFILAGRDSMAVLDYLCANNVHKPVGSITYTQMCNRRGGIECDLTVARIAEDEFYIVTGTGFATHDFHWIKSNIPTEKNAVIVDVTSSYACLALMGPNARVVLQAACGPTEDLSHTAFPFSTFQHISIGGVMVRALRVTYVGELGWELHIPVESACAVYDALQQASAVSSVALRDAGYRAIESLRLEKGYRAWGSDITANDSPIQAGLKWAVKLNTDISFIGREALELEASQKVVTKRLLAFTADPSVRLLGRETIFRNNERVGWLTSGGRGYTLNKSIGYGYIRSQCDIDEQFLATGQYELEVAADRVPCTVHSKTLFDPKQARIKI